MRFRTMAEHSHTRDIIVIGGSAGALEPLRMIAGTVRSDLPAAIFVVQHVAAGRKSVLASVLERSGPLPVVEAEDGAAIRAGVIQVAPPGQHLLLDNGCVRLACGPPENRARPAVDPLFRSAAANHDGRVVAVLLSGFLTDGAAGLYAVRRCGGLTIVQDPADAQVREMPDYALQHLEADYIVDAARIGTLLNELTDQPVRRTRDIPADIRLEAMMAAGKGLSVANEHRLGVPSAFACPDCNGNLWEVSDGRILRYRCHVGHAYSGEALIAAQDQAVEQALWSALRALRERAVMLRRLSDDAAANGRGFSVEHYRKAAGEVEQEGETLQRFIFDGIGRAVDRTGQNVPHYRS